MVKLNQDARPERVCIRRAPTLSNDLPVAAATRFAALRVDRRTGLQTELIQFDYEAL